MKMENIAQTNDKKIYHLPVIERIRLDYEISLALESDPPGYETNNGSITPEFLNNDPFKVDFI